MCYMFYIFYLCDMFYIFYLRQKTMKKNERVVYTFVAYKMYKTNTSLD